MMSSAQRVLQINYSHDGPYGDDMVDPMREMAHANSAQPGLGSATSRSWMCFYASSTKAVADMSDLKPTATH